MRYQQERPAINLLMNLLAAAGTRQWNGPSHLPATKEGTL
jgi:hypothetical protein